jgi:hypothetical protein
VAGGLAICLLAGMLHTIEYRSNNSTALCIIIVLLRRRRSNDEDKNEHLQVVLQKIRRHESANIIDTRHYHGMESLGILPTSISPKNKINREVDYSELEFDTTARLGKGAFGVVLKVSSYTSMYY